MSTRATCILLPLLGLGTLLTASCGKETEAAASAANPAASTPALVLTDKVRTVTATGTGKDEQAAMDNACTQAVVQACGAVVSKLVVQSCGHAASAGGTTFQGMIRSSTILQSGKRADGTCEVTMQAAVILPAQDRFASKLSLVIPEQARVAALFGQHSLSAEAQGIIAQTITTNIEDKLSQMPLFVVLERTASQADAERAFATTDAVRPEEHGKASGRKVADFVISLSVEKADEQVSTRTFAIARKTVTQGKLELEYTLRLVDVSTGGIVAMEHGSFNASTGKTLHPESCHETLMGQLKSGFARSVKETLANLFNKAGYPES